MKHRKLFQATDCSYTCNPRCPLSVSCIPLPGVYFPPPPPPPPPPHTHTVSPYVIIFVSLVASFLLFVACRVFVHKNGGCDSEIDGHQQAQSEAILDEIARPTRLFHTVGLEQSIINSIRACKYKKGERLIEGTECSVCLNEFQEDETVRILPKCNHAFHISCIDTWLRSNTNCPMCRAYIIPEIATSPLAAVDQNLECSNSTSETHVENLEIDRELGDNQERNRQAFQNRTRTEDVETTQDSVNSNENGVLQVFDDSRDDIQALPDDVQIKPITRSVSLDSSLAKTTCLGLADFVAVESGDFSYDHTKDAGKSDSAILVKQGGAYSGLPRPTGNSSTEQCLHKGPISMRRSFSCSSRFFC